MKTIRDLTDSIITATRQNYRDRKMSRRYIISVYKRIMKDLIAQKIRDRSLYREENLYVDIDCYEFEEIENKKCDIIEFRMCESIMKGRKRLPELIYTRYGDSIRMVTNLDGSVKINKTTPSKYIRDRTRRSYRAEPQYYVRDGYPYLLNTKMEAGTISVLTLEIEEAEKARCGDIDECKSSLDYPLIGSDKLINTAYQQTLQEILRAYIQVRPDENPDNNENNI
ncbi:MAG TPA: hypothetical protein VK031_03430 [Tissierellaceae bacterium]|nr:hypothetical protein [Tissierellaceae bacterium]